MRYGFYVLEKSANLVNELIHLESVDSTNLELVRILGVRKLPNFSALVAQQQTAGMGRLGRTWISEPGTSISVSMYLQSQNRDELSWATLIAAAAISDALSEFISTAQVLVKWPNDVLVEGRKICGILAQVQPDGSLILGMGINLRKQQGAPDTACSLEDFGVTATFDEVLTCVLTHFRVRWNLFEVDSTTAITKTLNEVRARSATLGQPVRAQLPGGKEHFGIATEIDRQGRLVILTPEKVVLSAADVWHLRN